MGKSAEIHGLRFNEGNLSEIFEHFDQTRELVSSSKSGTLILVFRPE